MSGMVEDPSEARPEPANLRFLRVLVTVLTFVMILGLATIIGLMIWRFAAPSAPDLPEVIDLPGGVVPRAVTWGTDWYAVVNDQDQILIFDRDSGELRQTVQIRTDTK